MGYDPTVYGAWPRAGAWVIKSRMPPSWKSTYDPSKFHTVTILLGHEQDPDCNPLRMPPGLEQIHDWHCHCKAGMRNAGSCCHRDAFLQLLCAALCINPAKVPEAVVVDTAR